MEANPTVVRPGDSVILLDALAADLSNFPFTVKAQQFFDSAFRCVRQTVRVCVWEYVCRTHTHTHAIGRPGATRSASSGGKRRISSIFRRAATLPPYAHTHRRTPLPNETEDSSAPFDNLTSAGLTSDVVQLCAVTAVLSAHGFKRCEMRAGERMSSVDTRKKKKHQPQTGQFLYLSTQGSKS